MVLMRRHPLYQQYPINKICSLHRSNGNDEHVIQPVSCTKEEDFWYTKEGLHKSIIFRTPRPDQDGKISIQMKLISMCNDSCSFHTENFEKLINISGKEKSRDTCLALSSLLKQEYMMNFKQLPEIILTCGLKLISAHVIWKRKLEDSQRVVQLNPAEVRKENL